VATGALSTPNEYYTGIGAGGQTYGYADTYGSTACVDTNSFCGSGTTAAGDGTGNIWGGGIGVHLNQAMNVTTVGEWLVPSASAGISYAVSNVPVTQGLRVVTDDYVSGVEYCALVSATSGTVLWTDFNSKCWQPSLGTYLSGPPTYSSYINFQAPAVYGVTGSFSFCVTALAYP
jgi:hypothetical protein